MPLTSMADSNFGKFKIVSTYKSYPGYIIPSDNNDRVYESYTHLANNSCSKKILTFNTNGYFVSRKEKCNNDQYYKLAREMEDTYISLIEKIDSNLKGEFVKVAEYNFDDISVNVFTKRYERYQLFSRVQFEGTDNFLDFEYGIVKTIKPFNFNGNTFLSIIVEYCGNATCTSKIHAVKINPNSH